MSVTTKYLIIGNSIAGTAAVEGIRQQDKQGEITIVGQENYPVYGRPLISYYLLGYTKRENIGYRAADFYEKNGVKLITGVRAEKLDADKKQVSLSDGSKITYEKLLVATGSRPFDPPMEGIESVKNRFHFMTLDDALALETALAPDKKVLIIGAGLIGLKCLEGILDRVASVTVVDLAPRILPSILDDEGAGIVQRQLEEKGVKFYLADSVAHFDENCATLKSGNKVDFDILVTAVGVRPNTELGKDAGGKIGRGICANQRGETTLKDVYAAGDCAESSDIASGTDRVLALLPNANFQGHCAGVNMAGGDEVFDKAVAMNAIGFFGTHVFTAGVYEGECYSEREGDKLKKLFYKDDRLKGFILIDMPERAGIYTMLLRNSVPLSSVDFEALKAAPGWNHLPESVRRERFSKEV